MRCFDEGSVVLSIAEEKTKLVMETYTNFVIEKMPAPWGPHEATTAATDDALMRSATTHRLNLPATPYAAAMLHEAIELTGVETFRAALDRVITGGVQRPIAEYKTGLEQSHQLRGSDRHRFSALPWRDLENHFLSHGLIWRARKALPATACLTSRAALTVAQVTWRLANDAKVRAHLSGERVDGVIGLEPPVELPHDRFEIADHAVAVVTATLVGDGVREALRRLDMSSGKKWHKLSPARILWAVYTSPDGPALVPRSPQVRHHFEEAKGVEFPTVPSGRRKITLKMVRDFEDVTRETLARRAIKLARHWCEPDVNCIELGDLQQRANHWSGAALTDLLIWLGGYDKEAHGRANEPW